MSLDVIRARMFALNLRQKDLATALDIDPAKVSKMFAGERQLKAKEMIIALEWLDGLQPPDDEPPKESAEVISIFDAMDARSRRLLLDMARTIARSSGATGQE